MKKILKKFPLLYSFLQRTYYALFRFAEILLGSAVQEWRWALRDKIKGAEWARSSRDTLFHPHRKFLVDRIMHSRCSGLKNFLEIGCNAGPNLILLSKALPHASFTGIDINRSSIKQGGEWLAELEIHNISLQVGRADDLSLFRDKSIECIFSDATLMYVGPDKIRKVIAECVRVASKAILLLEYHSLNSGARGSSYDGHWVYDYRKLFEESVPSAATTLTQLPHELWDSPGWRKYGTLIEVCV